MDRILMIVSLYLLSSALAMETPTQDFIGQAEVSNQKTQQISWDKIQELYQVYEKTQSPSIRTEIIHDLNRLLLNRQLDPSQREEALIMVEGLKAHHLALRLQQDQSPQEYGDLNALPQEIIHEIIQALVQDQVSFKDLKGVLFANKSFHKAMMSKPVYLDLSPYMYEVTDDILAQIIEIFPNIVSLNLAGCYQITNDGLEHLKTLTKLTALNLRDCYRITDHGLIHLKSLTNLTYLNLNGVGRHTEMDFNGLMAHGIYNFPMITDAGLEHLKELSNLKFLGLSGAKNITDEGIAHLKALTKLTSLNISGCDKITDDGLEHLQVFSNLTSLDLSNLEITDRGLEHLKRLARLTLLELNSCYEITDDGLEHLKELPNLSTLNLIYCYQLTDEAKQSLKAALPMLQITP